MKFHYLPLTFFILHSSLVILHAAPPPELTVLRAQYERVLAERVTAPFEAALATLNTKFTTALDNAAAEAKKSGSLPAVLAIEADKKRIADKLPLPDTDDEQSPESLNKLRAIYREQFAKLSEQRAANHGAILPGYTLKLQALETTLTKADRVDEAKEVLAYREALAPGLSVSTAQVAGVGVADKNGMKPGAPPEAPAPATAVKGDDRAAAELILHIGGKVKIVGVKDFITTADELPKKRFGLMEINLSTNGKTFLEEVDADRLAGLQELVVFIANNSIKADAALRFLPTCPNLVRVHVENCGALQGTWLKHAAPLRKLETLTVVSGARSDTTGIEAFQSAGLVTISLRASGITDATMATFGRFKKLRYLGLRDTKISDAAMAYLVGLPELKSLDLNHTPVTLDGVKTLGKAPLLTLGFGMTSELLAQAAPQLGEQFPKVETLIFAPAPGGKATAAQLAAVAAAWPKLKRLDFPSYLSFDDDAFASAAQIFPEVGYFYLWQDKITDQHIAGIAQMKKLATINLEGAQITDACLPALQNMKPLKTLYVAGTALTEPALAAFSKARPDVKVTK